MTALLLLIITQTAALAAPAGQEAPRKRLRELGIMIGRLAPGPLNAITDVRGVRVGHKTIKLDPPEGSKDRAVRTGVTAILPHGDDLWNEKVPAAIHVLNGNGEMTGSHWIGTQGALEVPIVLTNTHAVGTACDALAADVAGP